MVLDKLLKNGKIYTMESEGKTVEALGISNGVIVFSGTNEEASKHTSQKVIELKGKAVIPGMSDSHLHLYAYCMNKMYVNLENARSMDELIILMKEKTEHTPSGTWIKGVNFDQSKFRENRFPTRHDLDRISLAHPIVIKRCCLHAVVANTLALEMAKIGKGYCDYSGGIVEFEEDGMPNGILKEQSTKVFDAIMPDPLLDLENKRRVIKEVMAEMSAKGVTTIHTYAAKIWKYEEDIDFYREMEKQGELPVRVTVYLDELFTPESVSAGQQNDPHRLVNMGGYKIFSDGSLGSRSAALRSPYRDDPENSGFMLYNQEELTEKIRQAVAAGLQPAIHAIGDRALDMTIKAIEEALAWAQAQGLDKPMLPFRIIHVQMIDEQLVERMQKLPLVLDVQPIFLCTDINWIEERIGEERAKGAYSWKTLKDAGLILTGGSDCPVEDFDPLAGAAAAVNRCTDQGLPVGGYHREEKLSVYEALELFTKNPHVATGQQKQLGTLEVGKFADLVVLDHDPFLIDEKDLKKIKVVETYLAGQQVFSL